MSTPPGDQPPFDPNQVPYYPPQDYPPPYPPQAQPYPPQAQPYPPQAPGGYGPNPYPAYPGGPAWGPPVPPAHRQAMTAMVLGIVGLLCCSPAAPFAIWLGHKAMREIDASGGQLSGRGQAQAGFILGIIGTVLLVILLILAGTGFFQGFVQGFDQGYGSTSGS